jgi:hypothetical protein
MFASGMLHEFALKLLSEQAEEIGKSLDLQDKIGNIGNNKALLQLFDNTFES